MPGWVRDLATEVNRQGLRWDNGTTLLRRKRGLPQVIMWPVRVNNPQERFAKDGECL